MRTRKFQALLVAAAVAATTSLFAAPASQAVTIKGKTITCYKGKSVKKVTAAKPKCPTGWSTKKPTTTTTTKTQQFSGTFNGSGTLAWSASDVKVTSMTGTGGDTKLGLTKLTGTGSSSPQASTALIRGGGKIEGSSGSITFTLDSKSTATAASEKAPTTVEINATATITGGTGTYAGATGTLKITGNFSIKSTEAGSSETQSFKAVITGTINLK